jgi:predicted nucleic acid-binding protein
MKRLLQRRRIYSIGLLSNAAAKSRTLPGKISMNRESKLFIDTNILVYASLEDFEPIKYTNSVEILRRLVENRHPVFISTQIIREFLSVSTNKKFLKSPLSIKDANRKVKELIENFEVLNIDIETIDRLMKIAEKHQISGKNIHDAAISAAMLENEIKHILTYNKKDFEIYKEITIHSPEELLSKKH